MSVDIERSSIKELQRIVELNKQIFDGMYEEEPYHLEVYEAKLKDLDSVIFVARKGERIIGDSISFPRSREFYIWILGVNTEARKQGIGTRLIELNERYARKHDFESVGVKVYDTSPDMKRLLSGRGYLITRVDVSENDPKYNANHFRLNL